MTDDNTDFELIPVGQSAVQLTGRGTLELNRHKLIRKPGPYEILAKVECVGLCASDIKLLNQFSDHPRKSEIVGGFTRGLKQEHLEHIRSYVPKDKPTVPGHEVICQIVEVGSRVHSHKVGERYIVQADYRGLKTGGSNAAAGYNFEGGLQEYLSMDERVIMHDKQRFLIPVPQDVGASSVALVEPWACVEASYTNKERQTIKENGRLLIVSDGETKDADKLGLPIVPGKGPRETVQIKSSEVDALPTEPKDSLFDDIIYYGTDKRTIEKLNDRLANGAIINVVQGGHTIGAPVEVGVGRIHYGGTRWVGTTGTDASESYHHIPATGELRENDNVVVIGAEGPMGQMHVIRAISSGLKGLSIVAEGHNAERIAALQAKVEPEAVKKDVKLELVNTHEHAPTGKFSYWAINPPKSEQVARAINESTPGSIINIFGGIPAPEKHALDLDTYIANKSYMFGTSGSGIEDMKTVLNKVTSGELDTNLSVGAISGMKGAIDGLAAVANKGMPGKTIVYPGKLDIGLIPLSQLHEHCPEVAKKLKNGTWCKEAEEELLSERTVDIKAPPRQPSGYAAVR